MITLQQCITSARVAADAVWGQIGPGAFGWLECLTSNAEQIGRRRRRGENWPADKIGTIGMAQFLASRRDATAQQLFQFAIADDVDPRSWERAPPSLRAAVEVFRATFLVLLRLHEADVADAQGKHNVTVSEWRDVVYGTGPTGSKVKSVVDDAQGKKNVPELAKPSWPYEGRGVVYATKTLDMPMLAVEPAPPPPARTPGSTAVQIPILEERGRKYPRRNPRNGGKA